MDFFIEPQIIKPRDLIEPILVVTVLAYTSFVLFVRVPSEIALAPLESSVDFRQYIPWRGSHLVGVNAKL